MAASGAEAPPGVIPIVGSQESIEFAGRHNIGITPGLAGGGLRDDIITRAWTEDVFSYDGKFWSYKDVALWPRPVQKPHPA